MKPYAPLPAPPEDRPARVRVNLRRGDALVRECLSAQGGPDRPFPASVLDEKVRSLTEATYPKLGPTLLALADARRVRSAPAWTDIVADLVS